jgi:tetratricopeptide (TPR) repeat protein
MEERQTLRQATKLWQEAYRYQMEGELDRAIERYQRSIEAHPTAEAHTFLGWTLSFQGRWRKALKSVSGRSRSTPSSAIRITTSGSI